MRKEELNMDLVQYWGLITRWAIKTHDLNRADLELLIYLNPIKYFTIHDFKTGALLYTWDKTRFYRLQREDWITKIHDGKGRTGGHSKYVVSSKGKRLINRIGRILDGREDLNMDLVQYWGLITRWAIKTHDLNLSLIHI